MDDFETFTRDRIARLRAEADALEKTLKEYMSARARVAGAARRTGDNPRAGAFGVILEALAKAGPKGLSLDEMIEAAAEEGFTVNRNTLRSQLWQAKKDELVEAIGAGHYRTPPAPPKVQDMFDDALAPSGFQPSGFAPARAKERPKEEVRESFSADLDDEIPF